MGFDLEAVTKAELTREAVASPTDFFERVADGFNPTLAPMDPALQRRMDRVVRRLTELTDERDRLVIEARDAGASLREIAAHAGMSHVGVAKLLDRYKAHRTS